MRNYLNEKCCVVFNDSVLLCLLRADYMIIVAKSASDLQNPIDNLASEVATSTKYIEN